MARIRNAYSTPRGDVLMGAVFTVAQLRAQYSSNGGILTDRRKRYLRRFIPPYSDGTPGTGRRFAIMIPRQWAIENMPADVKAVLRPHFEVADAAWIAANAPWLGDSDFALNPVAIDTELGGELDDADSPDAMEQPE